VAQGVLRAGAGCRDLGPGDNQRVRDLPDPGFAGDDGSTAPELRAALTSYDAEPDALHDTTLGVLQHHRLLVPVVAVLGEVEQDASGLAHEKTSDMATVLVRGRDGRNALLAFTGSEAMARWDPDARPVPVTVATAAAAAVQDRAAAIVVDLAGPVTFVIDTGDLQELAAGHVLVEVSGRHGWVRPDR
jgi:hypothetical protein